MSSNRKSWLEPLWRMSLGWKRSPQSDVRPQVARREGMRDRRASGRVWAVGGGRRDGWLDCRSSQASLWHWGFSHSMPPKPAGHWQRWWWWHTPPFWQRRSTLSHTRAVGSREKERWTCIASLPLLGNTFQEKKCIHHDDHQVAVSVIVYDGCWREAQWCLLRTPQGMLVPL